MKSGAPAIFQSNLYAGYKFLVSKLKMHLIYDQQFSFVTVWPQGDFILKCDAERYLLDTQQPCVN